MVHQLTAVFPWASAAEHCTASYTYVQSSDRGFEPQIPSAYAAAA